eukprot:m.59641 g.59641  ORF g.59641 m.59641 type:complete len:296 (+) comp49265_c0_seq3:80-967(+)
MLVRRVCVALVALCVLGVLADDRFDFAISVYSNPSQDNSACTVGSASDTMYFLFVRGNGSCNALPTFNANSSTTFYYKLAEGTVQGAVSGSVFCDPTCTKCASSFSNLPWEQCVGVAVATWDFQMTFALQLASTPCIGGSDTPSTGLLTLEFLTASSCDATASDHVIVTNVAETDGNCVESSDWYNLTYSAADEAYYGSLHCGFYCSDCVITLANTSAYQCTPFLSGSVLSMVKLISAADINVCTFSTSSSAKSVALVVGVSMACVIAALLIAIPLRKRYFKRKVMFVALPEVQI